MTVRAVLAVLLLAVALHAGADDKKEEKIDPKLLIGRWSSDGKRGRESKIIYEYMKDGKMNFIIDNAGEEIKTEGSYKIDGNKLTQMIKGADGDPSVTRTIKKLTESEFVTANEKGLERKFVRVKGK
jgi:uncharacterized protein (TIGR03066 family)